MGFFDKLAFWKHEVPVDEPEMRPEDRALPPLPGERPQQGFGQQPFPEQQGMDYQSHVPPRPAYEPVQTQPSTMHKDMEIITLKLDNIKQSLDNIDRRLKSLERVAYGEQEKQW